MVKKNFCFFDIFYREFLTIMIQNLCSFVNFDCSYRAAIYANRHYLAIYHRTHPERLTKSEENQPKILGDVFIHPTATVHPSAKVMENCFIQISATSYAPDSSVITRSDLV